MIARVWFAKQGAGKGLPWFVKVDDGAAELCDNFQFVGIARPVFVTEGEQSLPEGPRGYIEVEILAAPTSLFGRITGWLARKAGWRI